MADLTDYDKALAELTAVQGALRESFKKIDGTTVTLLPLNEWDRDRFDFWNGKSWNTDFRISLTDRAKRPVATPAELAAFETWFDPGQIDHAYKLEYLARARALFLYWRHYAIHVLIPYLRATILVTVGDYAGAIRELGPLTGYDVGVAETFNAAGYRKPDTAAFFQGESLPYTTAVGFDEERRYQDQTPGLEKDSINKISWSDQQVIAPFEQRFFQLAQAEAMLAWADQLYKNDDPSSIRRARELFKSVLFLHGEDPLIAPSFEYKGLGLSPLPWALEQENPARISQLRRAALGLLQINMGLNVYAFRNDMVPVLRYRPLKQAADLFAASAKSAQTDFISYVTRFEQARIEGWQAAAMVQKAQAALGIAREQLEIAKVGVAKAQDQVNQVKAQIVAKQAEIDNKNAPFEEAKDFFSGMKDTFVGMAGPIEKLIKDDSAAGVASSEQLKDILAKGLSSGSSAAKEQAVKALGSGAGMAFAFADFAYKGYQTMSAMADAAAKRSAELKALKEGALPAAEAFVRLKERDTAIAKHHQDIAEADLTLARSIQRFQQDRFLNVDLWNKLAGFAQRLLRRYIELGASAAWLAERAAAFEQNREIRIIRMNYFPTAMRGLTSADRLLLDLAELESNRLHGIRLTTPVKHTVSLAREFPLRFGRLKKTGKCSFATDEEVLRKSYPSTFGYRIRAVTVVAHDGDGPPPRGVLRNLGVSLVAPQAGVPGRVLTRFVDGLPLSEFRLQDDLFVYGLPGETLLQFEGSGFETAWELEIPLGANPKGLATLSDVLITFDMNASYKDGEPGPGTASPVHRSVLIAASVYDAPGFDGLRSSGAAPAHIRFDTRQLPLWAGEKNRKITNLAVILAGSIEKKVSAKLSAGLSGVNATFSVEKGYAMSNAGLLLGTNSPLPLNTLVGLSLDQVFNLEIDRTGVDQELRELFDVVLYLEYQADLS